MLSDNFVEKIHNMSEKDIAVLLDSVKDISQVGPFVDQYLSFIANLNDINLSDTELFSFEKYENKYQVDLLNYYAA